MNKSTLSNYFNVAVLGTILCLAASILDLILDFNENEGLTLVSNISLIAGAVVWGIGLIGAGNCLCKSGYKETGIVSAGGALIFWALTLILFLIVIDQDNIEFDKLSFFIWYALTIIGPAIFYFSLKQEEGKEDKFFGIASIGMGMVIICDIVFIAIILLGLWMADGGGISISNSGYLTVIREHKYHVIGTWIFENYTLVMAILGIVTSLGYLLCTISMATYKNAIADLVIEPVVDSYNAGDSDVASGDSDFAAGDGDFAAYDGDFAAYDSDVAAYDSDVGAGDSDFNTVDGVDISDSSLDTDDSAWLEIPETSEIYNEYESPALLPEEEPSKSSGLKTGLLIAAGLLVTAGVAYLITSFCSQDNKFKDLMVEQNPPLIDPSNLGYLSELRLTGWSVVDTECEDISLKTVDEISINLDFDRGNADGEKGIPVKASILQESANGAESIYGKGYLKDGRLTLYEAGKDFYEYYEGESGWILLEADNIKNLAQFNATIHFSPEDEGLLYNLLDDLTWLKILDSTPTSVYEGPFGSQVDIQLIKPFGKNKGGIDALVFCYYMGIRETEYPDDDEPITSSSVLTALDSDGYILLDSDPLPYIGVAKWENDKLVVTREGQTFEMNLKERMVFQNAEIEESIAEMEGWEDF